MGIIAVTVFTSVFRREQTGIKIYVIASAVIFGLLCVFRTPVEDCLTVNLIFTAYFYSTKQTVKSDVIAVSRGIVVKALAIFLIPAALGEGYVWCSAAAAEAVTLVICLLLNKYKKV